MTAPTAPPLGVEPPQAPFMRYAQALKSVGDAEVVDALLPVLLQTLDDDVGRLDAAFEVRQLAAARAVLHGLKGVLPMFCSEELARQIVELEVLSKAGEVQAACTQWPALRAHLLLLREEVRVIIEKAV